MTHWCPITAASGGAVFTEAKGYIGAPYLTCSALLWELKGMG